MTIPVLTKHSPHCPAAGLGHTDAAKRISDSVNLHWAAGWDASVSKWIACTLVDGKGGEILYDTKRDAVRHQLDEFLCIYICLVPGGMSICEAEILIRTHRQMYDSGFRLADPDSNNGGRDLIPRVDANHRIRTLRMLGG
jgi:hypothetical protein